MLDLACIFTTGGVLLFYKSFCELNQENINAFVLQTILQDKIYDNSVVIGKRVYRWVMDTEIGLITLFVYQELFQDTSLNEMLSFVAKYYKKKIWQDVVFDGDLIYVYPEFDDHFDKILRKFAKQKQLEKQKKAQVSKPGKNLQEQLVHPGTDDEPSGSDDDEKKGKRATEEQLNSPSKVEIDNHGILKSSSQGGDQSPLKKVSFVEDGKDVLEETNIAESEGFEKIGASTITKSMTAREKAEAARNKKKGQGDSKISNFENSGSQSPEKGRKWVGGKINKKDLDSLDFSKRLNKGQDQPGQTDQMQRVNQEYFEEGDDLDIDFEFVSSEDEDATKKLKKSSILSSFKSGIGSFLGTESLNEANLAPILENFKNDLMAKNVAEEIARNIVNSLQTKLLNQKTKMFSSISSIVKQSLKETLTNILTPKRKIDILTEAAQCRERGEPYVLTFIGVNGVGKSTNLAKVAYLFKNQGFSVMLAACDSFRAGAVKQLQVHGNALNIPVFSKGHDDDPAKRAYDCIREARAKGIDVVLIDTAGRMQDNEPLMRELARLVQLNRPKLVIFIGEALVGNDGVDQLTKFNAALVNYSSETDPNQRREIDAIFISKFDTVDEKVGAAISMTYATGKPILFLGTGQKYPNLRRMDIDLVVNMLLS